MMEKGYPHDLGNLQTRLKTYFSLLLPTGGINITSINIH